MVMNAHLFPERASSPAPEIEGTYFPNIWTRS
jgi:hypothetical protein